MLMLDIFEDVNMVAPVEQRRFFNYFNDTVNELETVYYGFVVEKGSEYKAPESLDDDCAVRPLYRSAIVDNILFRITGEEARKSEFIRKSNDAYLKYWNDNARCRKLKRLAW